MAGEAPARSAPNVSFTTTTSSRVPRAAMRALEQPDVLRIVGAGERRDQAASSGRVRAQSPRCRAPAGEARHARVEPHCLVRDRRAAPRPRSVPSTPASAMSTLELPPSMPRTSVRRRHRPWRLTRAPGQGRGRQVGQRVDRDELRPASRSSPMSEAARCGRRAASRAAARCFRRRGRPRRRCTRFSTSSPAARVPVQRCSRASRRRGSPTAPARPTGCALSACRTGTGTSGRGSTPQASRIARVAEATSVAKPAG